MKKSELLAIFFWLNVIALAWCFILEIVPYGPNTVVWLCIFGFSAIFTTAIADSKPKK